MVLVSRAFGRYFSPPKWMGLMIFLVSSTLWVQCVSRSVVSDSFATPWNVAGQAPLSMGFCSQDYWRGLPSPSRGIFLIQGSNPGLLYCRQILYYPSTQWKDANYESGRRPSPNHAGTLILDFSASETVRNKFILFKSYLVHGILL